MLLISPCRTSEMKIITLDNHSMFGCNLISRVNHVQVCSNIQQNVRSLNGGFFVLLLLEKEKIKTEENANRLGEKKQDGLKTRIRAAAAERNPPKKQIGSSFGLCTVLNYDILFECVCTETYH